LDSGNVKAEDNLGMTYAKLGRASDAISAFQNAIAWQTGLAEKNPQPFIDLGSPLLDRNCPRGVIPHLLQATEIAPGNGQARELLEKDAVTTQWCAKSNQRPQLLLRLGNL
jgi:hypothetical protein